MPTSNVNLTPELLSFVEEQIETGNFKSNSEVHRAALAAMKKSEEERQARIARLSAEIQKGDDNIEAGQFTEINSTEDLSGFMASCRDQSSRRVKARGVKVAP